LGGEERKLWKGRSVKRRSREMEDKHYRRKRAHVMHGGDPRRREQTPWTLLVRIVEFRGKRKREDGKSHLR